MDWFGHNDIAFYILSKAEVFNNSESQYHKSLYITTLKEDFKGGKRYKPQKNKKKKSTIAEGEKFNYDAYKDISYILHGNEGNRQHIDRQRLIASCLIDTLDGKKTVKPEFEVDIIRAMVMALAIPFIAEICPPSDEALCNINKVKCKLQGGSVLDKSMEKLLKARGGGNPGCHRLLYCLFGTIKEGTNTFKKVLRHRDHSNQAKPDFLPSMTGGVLEYRRSMFNKKDEALLKMAAEINLVSISIRKRIKYKKKNVR